MPKRRLPGAADIALDVIALMGRRSLSLNEFELRMHERGCDVRVAAEAIAALERRGWAMRVAGQLEMSEDGYAAAVRGVAVPSGKARRAKNPRLSRGLFA